MTAIYQQSGLRFLYPENWELDNRDDEGQPWSVSVHSPTGAFWSLTVYTAPPNLDRLAEETLSAIEEEYTESFFESSPAEENIAGHAARGYDLSWFYLDFLIAARLRVFRISQHACVVLYQAEDRDFAELQRVFEAITFSLLSPDEIATEETPS